MYTGSEININKALKLIRTKFPERAYPELTLECISPMLEASPVISQLFKVNFIIYLLVRILVNLLFFFFFLVGIN